MKGNRANIWRIGILFASIAIVGALSISRPAVFAKNRFLQAFMGPDMVSVLIVMLTITFASVANIHLSITRMVALAPDRAEAAGAAGRARAQLNTNAWTIFWAFAVSLLSLIVNGEYPKDELVQSTTTGVCLVVLILNGLVMHDIYRSIFLLVANEPQGASDKPDDYS
ncbi:hypothetical protein C8J25_109135 [Sphingomonas faeni]|uniref:Uncharacterized protein n=1 Tax=Sphingomonas faeni TaxID=185950 RepID=A0A2T5TZN0_9SPHN|nr:hypothetical protein [Sphingomonas faeni]PTW44705.1 hypothetical protein C8J25_109135 [Sphingomonas faeni]